MKTHTVYETNDYKLDNGELIDGPLFISQEECLQFEMLVSQPNWQKHLSDEINKIWKESINYKLLDNKEKEFIEHFDLIVEPVEYADKWDSLKRKELNIGFFNQKEWESYVIEWYDGQEELYEEILKIDFLKQETSFRAEYYYNNDITITVFSKPIEKIFEVIKSHVLKYGITIIRKVGDIAK